MVRVGHVEQVALVWAGEGGGVMGSLTFSQDHLQNGWSDTP